MDQMIVIARAAMAQMPPSCRLQPTDGDVIHALRESLLPLEREVVQGFYDTLYAHEPTKAVFADGERPAREQTLSHWWQRTVNGPLDDDYFAWMALVGLVHVIREVSNPMMLAMADHVGGVVATKAADLDLDDESRTHLVSAFRRLGSTVGAVITYAYDHAVSSALFDVAGMPPGLLRRLRNAEIASALATARAQT
jgi:hypothetical protein